MNLHSRAVAFATLAVAIIVTGVVLLKYLPTNPAPDFQSLSAGQERKRAFFEYFLPLIQRANTEILDDRRRLLTIADADDLSWQQRRQLQRLTEDYRLSTTTMKPAELVSELLLRVDEVPPSLALAQAAKESGWGTARFAIEGNNYFGQRCWETGCGMLPRNREAGMKHEVARFRNPYASLTSYFRNLNSHSEYAALRAVRAQPNANGSRPSGSQLADTLGTYSERQQAYIDEIKSLIKVNKLELKP